MFIVEKYCISIVTLIVNLIYALICAYDMKNDLPNQLRRDFLNNMSEDIRTRLIESSADIKVSLAGYIDIEGCDPSLINEAFEYWKSLK